MNITRARTCRGKQRHASLGAAWAAIRSLAKRNMVGESERLVGYFCIFCRGYHVGHRGPSQWERQQQEGRASAPDGAA